MSRRILYLIVGAILMLGMASVDYLGEGRFGLVQLQVLFLFLVGCLCIYKAIQQDLAPDLRIGRDLTILACVAMVCVTAIAVAWVIVIGFNFDKILELVKVIFKGLF